MRSWKLAAASLVLVCSATTQDVAPEVLLLARIKSHMREELSNLPNYTCLETITRFRNEPGQRSQSQRQLKPADTVRLEIVYSNHQEWYGSPGGRSLSATDPFGFVGSGMIGTGPFGLMLGNILAGATITHGGEEPLGDRTVVRYDFLLPRLLKGLAISVQGGSGTVGQKGSFWADARTLDLIRLESYADEIPPYLPVEEESSSVDYARMRIGEYNVLLAQEADFHQLQSTGEESYDRLEFTHCRAFSAQSAIRFDGESQDLGKASPAIVPAPAGPGQAIPALLLITVQLTTPVTDKDVVGTLIEGKVSGDVRHKGRIVISDGLTVRGRIRRLERYQEKWGGDSIVGLEFTEVEASGGPRPFYADLLRMDRNPGIRPTLSEPVVVKSGGEYKTSSQTITLPELPGVASFFVHGQTFTIPAGFRTVWRTRGPIR